LIILSIDFNVLFMRSGSVLPIFRNRPIAALAVICLGVFVISVDATIVNVALPTLSRELGADTAQLQWIVDAYTLVMSGLLLSAGSLSDRYGRRGWLNAGLALFAITSGIAAQVNSADALIAARAAMGVGAAVIFPTTLGLITNIFTHPVARARAIGLWAAMVGVGVAVGPISGGWLLEHFWRGSIFMVNIPVATLAIVGGLLFVPTSSCPRQESRRWSTRSSKHPPGDGPTGGPRSGSSRPQSFWPGSRCGSGAAPIRC
jgi:MFS family permease